MRFIIVNDRCIQYRTAAVRYFSKTWDKPLYDVDQLKAMGWVKVAWNMVSRETIENCFKHTGLFDGKLPENENRAQLAKEEDFEISETLDELVTSVHESKCSIDSIDIVPEGENEDIHETRTSEEIVEDILAEMTPDKKGMLFEHIDCARCIV